MFPPFSDWLKLPDFPTFRDQWHPLVVHFPIALLLVAPLLVLLAMLLFRKGRWLSFAALVLLALGTAGAYLAVYTGEDAARVAADEGLSKQAAEAVEAHATLAEAIPLIFAILTGAYLAVIVVPLVIRPLGHPIMLFLLNLVFLAALLAADLLVVNAGYLGGRVVHEFGVRAQIEAEIEAPAKAEQPPEKAKAEKREKEAKLAPAGSGQE